MTGYPIVDAGMRQLNDYGWASHRIRSITSQFLTKHLLIDWRFGERYFMKQSIDADFALNNAGWQWGAFTGPSTQPTSWRFSPTSQGKSFNSSGDWIKKYVPELTTANKTEVHEPWKSPTPFLNYPAPLVNPEQAILRFSVFYKAIPWKK